MNKKRPIGMDIDDICVQLLFLSLFLIFYLLLISKSFDTSEFNNWIFENLPNTLKLYISCSITLIGFILAAVTLLSAPSTKETVIYLKSKGLYKTLTSIFFSTIKCLSILFFFSLIFSLTISVTHHLVFIFLLFCIQINITLTCIARMIRTFRSLELIVNA